MTVADKLLRAKDDYDTVYSAGKEAERDAFWDIVVPNDGEYHAYDGAFASDRWNDDAYNPKNPILASSAGNIFQATKITDTKVPLDITANSASIRAFNWAQQMETIRSLKLYDYQTFTNFFYRCDNLTNLTITDDSVIGNDLSIQWSPKLTADSIRSVVNALSSEKDENGDYIVTGKTLTLSQTAVDQATFGEEIALQFIGPGIDVPDITVEAKDGSIIINGKSSDAECYCIENTVLPMGYYDISLSADDDIEIEVLIYSPSGYMVEAYTVTKDSSLRLESDAVDTVCINFYTTIEHEYNNVIFTPTLIKVEAFEDLTAEKPNWTITLV